MIHEEIHDGRIVLYGGDCLEVLAGLDACSVDAVVCDPPYELGFMGRHWDSSGVAFQPETWARVLRVLKPGAHLVAFSGTRTYHRMAVAIEDAGFEIRDQLAWVYGSGFPKSMDISKAIDKAAGATREVVGVHRIHGGGKEKSGSMSGPLGRSSELPLTAPATDAAQQWAGWGTALKPAWEPICLARKPLSEKTVAANVLKWGAGALNIDATRVATTDNLNGGAYAEAGGRKESQSLHGGSGMNVPGKTTGKDFVQPLGRWPANLAHDGSEEVLTRFPETKSGTFSGHRNKPKTKNTYGSFDLRDEAGRIGDAGSAARFFYCAKASAKDRAGSKHPTVKPVALMRWLVRMVTPPGGVVLDPFAGTGTTGQAALEEGFKAVLIEREEEYLRDIARRLDAIQLDRQANLFEAAE
jgi:DNA modification methylase